MSVRLSHSEALLWLEHQLSDAGKAHLRDQRVRDYAGLTLLRVEHHRLEDAWWQVRALRKALDAAPTAEAALLAVKRLHGLTWAYPRTWWQEIPT